MPQIHELIPKIMREVGAIGKDRKNQMQGYNFRGIDDVYNAINAPLAANGVFIVPTVLDMKREERQTQKGGMLIYTILTVKHTFFAPDGSSFDAVTIGEAMDSGDKSGNKAMSAAMKYALIEVFAIPTIGDNDIENHTHQVAPKTSPATQATAPATIPLATEQQTIQLGELLSVVTMPDGWADSCLKKAGVKNWREMPGDKIAACIKVVMAKQKKGGK